jgi:hypothetical protein
MKTAGSLRVFKEPEKNRSFFGQFFHENRRFFKGFRRTRPTPPSFQIFFQRIRTGGCLRFGFSSKEQNRQFFDPGIAERTRTGDGSSTLALLRE